MAQIVSFNNTTLLTINRQIVLLDLNNGRCPQIIDLPAVKATPKNSSTSGEHNSSGVGEDADTNNVVDADEVVIVEDDVDDAADVTAAIPAAAAAADDTNSKNSFGTVASNRILHAAVSPNGQLLAVATADEKCLHLYQLTTVVGSIDVDVDDEDDEEADHHARPFASLLSSRPLSRTSNALRFSADSQLLFVADKTGDCFTYACVAAATDDATVETVDAAAVTTDAAVTTVAVSADAVAVADPLHSAGQCVLSHLSMVLGILHSPCGQFVLSCDRDEKIRCTNFPRTTLVESYCLGHTEYVAGIEFLPTHADRLLVSVSGDRTMRLWNYLDGRQQLRFELPAAALRLAVRPVSAVCSHVAVTLFEHEHDVIVYEVFAEADDTFAVRAIGEFELDGIVHVQSATFDVHGDLLLAAITKSDETAVFRLSSHADNDAYVLDPLDALNAAIAAQAADLLVPHNAEEVSLLFKKKFENIHDYKERKRRRIDEKNEKNSKRNFKADDEANDSVVMVED